MTASARHTTVWILSHQLTPHHSALAGVTPDTGVILMIESWARARQHPYDKQKLVLLWSAMRHFAAELRAQGYTVDYYETQPNLKIALAQHLNTYRPQRVRLMEANELVATKPYAASANYINKMSDCCTSCHYNPRQLTGATACPCNVLYWDFLNRHATILRQNPRMNLVMALLDKRDTDTMQAVQSQAAQIKSTLRMGGRL